ncbi:MAG: PmoA family protein [Opitutaceae bacterium]|nr:PmoA family protein [Opitutaceae bacterium]
MPTRLSSPLLFCVLVCSGSTMPLAARPLTLREDVANGTLSVLRAGEAKPILVQNAGLEHRPYLHPLVAPDGKGVLTEFSPSHHQHQTGIYWGITRLNGRDFFHHPGPGYWKRVSTSVLIAQGEEVKWSTVYHLLDADGKPLMLETQVWSMRDSGNRYLLDVEWTGQALTDLTIGEYEYGGLFVRMPWRQGIEGSVINSNRQRNERANGQRAVWVDVGMKIDGRDDPAHIALFDHPLNNGYPLPWRVDSQLGVGPSRATLGEWKLARDKPAIYRHQFVVYTGTLNDVQINEDWRAYTGERSDSVLWNLARAEGKKAGLLTGEQAVAKMTVPAGYEVKLYASEPAITQPMAFCWDDRGRLWVAENRDYETRRSGFSGSGDSRILILEDTDGDGKMDTRKVFLDGIPFPAAIAWGFNGLWLGAPPNLLFVPDRDHDDKADRDAIEIRLTGWGITDRHETLNSLSWGPDGWLYGCQGYATPSRVGKPADAGRIYKPGEPFPQNTAVKDGQFLDGGVWRYHPTKDRFEVVAHGFSNPWGLDFDDHGQMFITACVIPHLWHVIPGGIYHRQGGKHINPYVYSDIKTIADHRHRSAHGGARVYLAEEFPQDYRGRIFMANLHERALLTDILEPKGSGFVGHHGDDTVLANDPQWVGFSIEIGPDGAVYILDWHDADICGTMVNHKDTGRIFRFAPKGLPGKTGIDIAAKSDLELVELQSHRNDWYVRRARLQLQQRAAGGRLDARVAQKLWNLFSKSPAAATKLRALWALHVTKNLPADRLAPMLDHTEPYIRAWAVQLLCEDSAPAASTLQKFATMAKSDRSAVVRLYLAAALQRIPGEQRWPIAEALVGHGEDANDHNLPNMIWFGVEPLVAANATRALALATRSELSVITQFVARRATAAKQLEAIIDVVGTARAATRQALLEGLRDGLTSLGRREVSAPGNWAAAEARLRADAGPALRDLLTRIGQLFGDARAAAAQLVSLQDASLPVERRREILQSFARDAYAPALGPTVTLLDEAALRRDAIRALGAYDSPRVAEELLRRYTGWPAADKAEAVLTLSARKSTADPLVAALKKGTIPKRDISAFVARQLQRVVGPSFVDFWGPLAQPAEDKQADIAKFRRLLTDDALARANPSNGRAIFERTCFACHTLYGQGGKIGPDITGSNRANLDYILTEIINPGEVIQEGYHLVTINTRDGRTLAGNVVAEDDQQVTLRLIGQDSVVAKPEILSRERSNVSMMPEGLLKTLSQAEVRDLIAYLRTSQQVPLPK